MKQLEEVRENAVCFLSCFSDGPEIAAPRVLFFLAIPLQSTSLFRKLPRFHQIPHSLCLTLVFCSCEHCCSNTHSSCMSSLPSHHAMTSYPRFSTICTSTPLRGWLQARFLPICFCSHLGDPEEGSPFSVMLFWSSPPWPECARIFTPQDFRNSSQRLDSPVFLDIDWEFRHGLEITQTTKIKCLESVSENSQLEHSRHILERVRNLNVNLGSEFNSGCGEE